MLEQRELKQQKFWMKFEITVVNVNAAAVVSLFEVDNAKEDFSEESIFAIAANKARELDFVDYTEPF